MIHNFRMKFISSCVYVHRSSGKLCGVKYTLDGHTFCLIHRRCKPEQTCEVCEDWSVEKWQVYHKRIAETKKRSTRSRDGKSHSKVRQGEVLPGANNVPPLDGFGIIPNGSTGVIPSACTDGATGVIPSACTNGASEVKVAQIPSGQSIAQQTMLSPTPKGVESPHPGGRASSRRTSVSG